ncbi:helix-turn-helix domain-containing protein [Bradyrhizobium sp. Pa8]|uniref:helix-turn-helix domain-containing protein n=1 Tax=Bradyrhizobium sp. Pa8 TaxID=3386552 RepID=UPI00403F0DD3
MSESSQRIAALSSFKQGTVVPDCSPEFKNGFAIAARALWPRKTAAELAFRANVSERAAKFWLSGEREPSLDACMVILDAIRPRRRA